MRSKFLWSVLLAFACNAVFAADSALSWNLNNQKLWKQSGQAGVLSHNFGKLGKVTDEGFHFIIDDKYHHVEVGNLQFDTNKYTHLEVYRSGCMMLFTLLAYGPAEGGYDKKFQLNGNWDQNNRYYPAKTVLDMTKLPRWKQGNIKRFQILFANSGNGSDGVIHAMALRRGADTFKNGAFILTEKDGSPAFWSAEKSVKVVSKSGIPYPICQVPEGKITTALDSLKPGHRYNVSVYCGGKVASVKVQAVNRNGDIVIDQPLKAAAEKMGDMTLYTAEYIVPEDALQGELIVNGKAYALADALLEDMGGAASWRAKWIWHPSGVKENQHCHFRKEFYIEDPAEIDIAFMQATCDDAITLEVNNNRIFNYNIWSNPQFGDVKKYLLKGKNVITVSGYNGGSFGGMLCELKLIDKNQNTTYIYSDDSWGCRLTWPGDNWRRVNPPEETKKEWVKAKVYYQYTEGPWGNMVRYREKMPEAANRQSVDKAFYASQKTVAKMNYDLKHPRMEVNGEIVTPMLYGVCWRGDRTSGYNYLQKSGFKLFRMPWEFSFEAWREDGSVDYRELERIMTEFLENVPDGKVVLEFRLSPPPWWQLKYPDQLIKFADGTNRGADGVFASPASTAWREETAGMVRKFIAHIEKQWYASAIIAYMPCNLRGPEWVIPQKHNCFPDYSEPMQKYFREYLRNKYKTDAALQKAWKNPTVTFETAQIPPQKVRQPKGHYFLGNDRQDVMDYNRSVQQANVDSIMAMLDAIKDSAPDKLRFLYFGYLMTLSHISANPPITGHYDLSRLLASGKVDVMASPITYSWRYAGDISGTGTVESSYRKHGILWLQEADNRTYLTPNDEHAVTHHAQASLTENWREFIYAALKREAVWFFEIGPGWYDNDYIHEDFRKMLDLYGELRDRDITYQTPVAYFFDEKFVDGVSLNEGNWGAAKPFNMSATAQRMIALSGVQYDMFELEDIYTLDLSQYKVFYFQNAWRKNPRLAKFLKEKVYPAGITCVWLYAPGYAQKGGLKGMKELTGMDFELLPEKTPLYFKTNSGKVAGLPGQNQTEAFAATGNVDVLARYPNGKIAAAWKPMGKGNSVWLASFDNSGELLRDVLIRAGVQPLIDRGDRVLFDGEFVGVFVIDQPGKRTVTLPVGSISEVWDYLEEKSVKHSGNTFEFDAKPGEIKLFRITK